MKKQSVYYKINNKVTGFDLLPQIFRKVVKSAYHRGKLLPLRISPALPLVAPACTGSPGLQK